MELVQRDFTGFLQNVKRTLRLSIHLNIFMQWLHARIKCLWNHSSQTDHALWQHCELRCTVGHFKFSRKIAVLDTLSEPLALIPKGCSVSTLDYVT